VCGTAVKTINYISNFWISKKFDRVSGEVIGWATCKLGADEWLVSAVMSMNIGPWKQ